MTFTHLGALVKLGSQLPFTAHARVSAIADNFGYELFLETKSTSNNTIPVDRFGGVVRA